MKLRGLLTTLALMVLPMMAAAQSSITPPPGLVAWWPGDGDARDPIGLHHGALANGAGYTNGFNGQAFVFDGSNDQLIIPDANDLDMTNALTLAAWVKVRAFQDWGAIMSKGEGSQVNYSLNTRGDGRFKLSLAFAQDTVVSLVHGVNEWHFVAGTWDGTNARVYVDGVLEGTTPFTGSLTLNTGRLFLGADPAGSVEYFKGLIDEAAVWNRALSSNEIAGLYAAGSAGMLKPTCLPPPPGLAGWWSGDGKPDDAVGSQHGTLRNQATYAVGKVGAAFDLDGVDDFVEATNVVSHATAFSFCTWLRVDSFTHPNYMPAFSQTSPTDPGVKSGFNFYVGNAGADFGFEGDWTDGTAFDLRTAIPFGAGVWKHVAATYDGAVLKQYVDGALLNQGNYAGKTLGNTHPFLIGKGYAYPLGSVTTNYFDGRIDELQFFTRALTSNEVATIFAADRAGLCKSTPPLNPPQALVAWWACDGDARDVTGQHPGDLVNGVGMANGMVGQALSFDGSNDQVVVPDANELDLTNSLTLAVWVKVHAYQEWGGIICKGEGSQQNYALNTKSDGRFKLCLGLSQETVISLAHSVDEWHFVAGTWDGAYARIYVDGVLEGIAARTGPLTPNSGRLFLGADPPGSTEYFNGLIDEAAVWRRALSPHEVMALFEAGSAGVRPPVSVAPPSGLAAWWPLNADLKEVVGGADGVAVGTPSYSAGVVQSSIRLDGQEQWISIPSSGILNGRTEATIEAWVRPQGQHGSLGNPGAVWFEGTSTFGYTRFALFVLNDGHVRVGGRDSNSGAFKGVDSLATLPTNVWTHVAGTWRAGEGIKVYINGTLDNTQMDAGLGAFSANASYAVCIGSSGMGPGTNTFNGGLDEIAVYGRELSPPEIAALHAAGSAGKQPIECVSPPDGVVAWWRGEGDARDTTGHHPGTLENGVGFTNGVVGQALDFDGSDDRLVVSDADALDFTNALTLAAWVKPRSFVDWGGIVSKGEGNLANLFGYSLCTESGGRFKLSLALREETVRSQVHLANAWYLVVGTWDGTNACLYVNGVREGQTAFAGSLNRTAGRLFVGADPVGSAHQHYNGLIDEVLVLNRALSSNEVATLHAAGAAGLCEPQCVPPFERLAGWWPGNDHAQDLAGGMNGVLQGAATYAPGKVGPAFQFNGGTDSVLIAPPLVRLTNQFTIAAWINPATHANEPGGAQGRAIVSRVGGAGGNNGYQFFLANGHLAGMFNTATVTWNNAFYVASPSPVSINTWSHVAWTYDQSAMRLYINGMPVATNVIGLQTLANTTSNLRISRDDNANVPFNGLIDEVILCSRALTEGEIAALHAAQWAGLCAPQCTPPPAGLSHWFQAEDRTDDAVTGLTGALEGGATFAAGRVGQAFSLDGANDFISYTNFPNVGTNSFSVALWYRADASSAGAGNMKIVNKGRTIYATPYLAGFYLQLEAGQLDFALGDSAEREVRVSTSEPAAGTWHHIVATVDRSSSQALLYVDGALLGLTNFVTLASLDTDIHFAIGALDRRPGNSAKAGFFDGLIDEVLFFDRPLTAGEVAALHAAGSAGICPTVSFDATSAFSIAHGNPNGVWSYGWMPTDFSGFNLHAFGENRWHGPAWSRYAGGEPVVWQNTTPSTQWGVPPGWLSLHPGSGNQPSVIRWTAPASGVAHVVGQFLQAGGTLPVTVRLNGQPWWTAPDYGSFDLITNVIAGSTVDFAVYGGYASGNTPLDADITLALDEGVAPAITVQPSSTTIWMDSDVTFQVGATGPAPLAYQWYHGSAVLAGATNPALVLTGANAAHAGSYFAVVTNNFGAVTSAVATLTVKTCQEALAGLVSWWPGDGAAADLAGNHSGTVSGATYAEGIIGLAFNFDGVDDYVDVGSWSPGPYWTLGAWVQLNSAPDTLRRTIVGGVNDCLDWAIGLQNGQFGVLIRPPSTCTETISSGIMPNTNEWYYVVCTCDGTTARIYVNGELRNSGSVLANYTGTAANVRIGGEYCCPGANFAGLVDEVTVFGRALGSNEIAAIYAAGSVGVCKPTPPIIARSPATTLTETFRDVALEVFATGSEPLRYQWYFNNNAVTVGTNATLRLPRISTNEAGSYSVIVTNAYGAATSKVAVVTVIPDTGRPTVVGFAPTGTLNTNVSRLTLQFSERVNTNTLAATDVTVVAPAGALNPETFTLLPVAPFDDTAFVIVIPSQSADGLYQVQIGPNIADYAGNSMVAPFTAQFTLDKTGPAVTNVTPSGVVSNTITFFDVSFDSAFATASLSAADVVVTGTGAPVVQSVSARGANGFRATLASPMPQGDFFVTVGPNVSDVAGNPMGAAFNTSLTVFLPDLAVNGIVAPATALAGQPLNLVWTVTNRGPGNVTGPWKSRVQLATNSIGGGAVTLGTFTATNLMSSTAALSQTGLVILPSTVAGDRWLVIIADVDNEVFENTETNNTLVAAAPITLQAPDLAAVNLTAPASAPFGQTLNVSWAVTNVGTAPASSAWSDRILVSRASDSISNATPLTTVAASLSPLPAGSGYVRTATVTLPFDAQSAPGSFWLVAVADYADAQAEANEVNNLRSAPISLTLPPLPDLAVTGVIAPTNALPNQSFTLIWAVTNLGPVAATGVWSETILLTNAASGTQTVATFAFTNNLAAAGALARTQSVSLPINGPAGDLRVLVQVDSRDEVVEAVEANNVAGATNLTTVPLALTLQLPAAEIAEDTGTPTLPATITRNGPRTSALTVTLTNSDPTELNVPASVVIPAGAASASFNVTVLPDFIADGPQTVAIGASGVGYQSDRRSLVVLNTDLPQLTFVLQTNAIREGSGVLAWVARDWVTSNDLLVTLAAASPAQITVPPNVIIPAYSNSVRVSVVASDDTLIEPDLPYVITAAATGFRSGAESVTVMDDDTPEVTLTLSAHVVSESAGPQAAAGTVTRQPVSTRAVVIELTSTNPGAATVPTAVTIPANVASATFSVAAVNDAILDGPQTTLLGGYVLASGSSTRVVGITPDVLTVTDDDGAALGLSISPKLVKEGVTKAATVTVTRNTPATNSLVVNLSSSDATEATVPTTVTIPSGQHSVTASLASVADGGTDGNQNVLITAAATGFAPASDTVVVSDSDLADLFVATVGVPAEAETESLVDVTYRVANQGFVSTSGEFVTRVFLSSDNTVGDDTLVGQYRFAGALPPGQFFEQTLPARLPREAGKYWIIVQTDAEGALSETLEDNNARISSTPITARAAYRAWVQTAMQVALAGTPVPMSGRATNELGMGMAYKLVNVHIGVRGTDRVISAVTDANGYFAVTFQPLPNEAGGYEIFATHPGTATGTVQDTFSLLGIKAQPATASIKVIEGSSTGGSLSLQNLSDQPLTGLSVEVLSQPAGLSFAAALSTNTLAGLAEAFLSYTLSASTTEGSGVVELLVTTTQGAEVVVTLAVTVEALRPVLVTEPGELVAGMARGKQAVVAFDVVNNGGLASGPITVSLPVVPWLQLASTNPLPSLVPGATNRVTLLLTPPEDMVLGPYTGNLALNCAGDSRVVPFTFRALSEARGDLLVEAEDEFTYFAAGAPRVAGAGVTVRDVVNGVLMTNGLTGVDGRFIVPNLAEGYYEVEVTASAHDTYRATRLLLAGQTNNITAFLRRQSVQYIWSVVPTEIEDRTKIVLETTFETFVPAPVVTIEPASIDLAEIEGDVAQVNLKISNHGLIAAEDVRLDMPTDSDWRFTPLITDVGTLAARSSLTVPLIIERVRGGRAAKAAKDEDSGDGCIKWGSGCYQYWCSKWIKVCMSIALLNPRSDCVGDQPPAMRFPIMGFKSDKPDPGGGGGAGTPAIYGVGGPPNYVVSPSSCQECIKVFTLVLTQCSPEQIAEHWAAFAMAYNMVCLDGAARGEDVIPEIYDALKPDCSPDGIPTPPPLKCFTLALECPGWWPGGGGKRLAAAESVALKQVSPALIAGSDTVPRSLTAAGLPTASESYVGLLPEALKRQVPLTVTVAQRFDRVMTKINLLRTIFGDETWIESLNGSAGATWLTNLLVRIAPGSEQGSRLSVAEQAQLRALPLPTGLTSLHVSNLVARCNRTADYNVVGVHDLAQVPSGQSTDFITRYAWTNAVTAVNQAEAASRAEGFSGILESAAAAYDDLYEQLTTGGGGGGVCAQVRLRIEQEAVITRDAFKATLDVLNQSDSPLRDVSVIVTAKRADGQDATGLFGIRPPTLENLSAVDGTGVISEQTTGRATWILIPTQDAAPDAPVEYYISGTLRYVQDGLLVTVPLSAVAITVHPSPRLFVKYFHQRDVYADDPFTDVVEPSVPFNLAVMIENRGKGDAKNVRITSAQPEIIENEMGLLIDFQIIATEVAGRNLVPSLTAEFGAITNGQTAIGRWLLTSTLQGLFTDYQASFEHLDGLGNQKLSLIEEVTIHELIQLVRAPGALDDGKFDFLVNAVPDPHDLPDTLFLSNGTTNPVEIVERATVDAAPSASHLQVQLTAPMPGGWAYLRVPEPGDGRFLLKRVVRSDGSEIALGTNVWTTDRTFIGLGRRPIKESILHLLDYNSPGGYTLFFETAPALDATAPTSSVAGLPAGSPELFQVQWTGSDNAGEVASYDVFVSANGGAFVPWLQKTKLTAAAFQGTWGGQYAFYTVATDAAGNRETAPVTPDAMTRVTITNHPPVISAPGNQFVNEGTQFILVPAVTDADLPSDQLTYSLLGAPPGMTISATTGEMRWTPGEGNGPSTNAVTWRVHDNLVPQKSATNTFLLIVNEVNTAPTMALVTNTSVLEGRWLYITNSAMDTDLPAQKLTWSLVNAPAGATIESATGLFRWRPNEVQGGVTNVLTFVVRDNGPGQLGATQTVLVAVVDALSDFTIGIGTTNLLAGGASSVSLYLNAGVPLTNIAFSLGLAEARLTNLVLQPRAVGLSSSSIQRVTNDLFRVTFETTPGRTLQGMQELARLSFNTPLDSQSAIVTLQAAQVMGTSDAGVKYANGGGGLGRVFVIGDQPILADLSRSGESGELTVYGRPGRAYELMRATNLKDAPWLVQRTVAMKGTAERVLALPAAEPGSFYRLVEGESGGLLSIRNEGGKPVIEWLPVRPNCKLEEAVAIGAGVTWAEASGASIVMTNGVARVTLSPASGTKFYRLRCD